MSLTEMIIAGDWSINLLNSISSHGRIKATVCYTLNSWIVATHVHNIIVHVNIIVFCKKVF